MVDGTSLGERPHFLVIMALLAEHPFEMGRALSPLDFPPHLTR